MGFYIGAQYFLFAVAACCYQTVVPEDNYLRSLCKALVPATSVKWQFCVCFQQDQAHSWAAQMFIGAGSGSKMCLETGFIEQLALKRGLVAMGFLCCQHTTSCSGCSRSQTSNCLWNQSLRWTDICLCTSRKIFIFIFLFIYLLLKQMPLLVMKK